ncbi:Peptidase M20D, amidohydrolase [gamma proteobacterium HdN1]|nr:Peptidase M20D, amidohydrolase [gamma proteobacterium HdN1]
MKHTCILPEILAHAPALQAIRRDIHAHPELAYEEVRTSDLIAQKLAEWDIEVHRGLGITGLVGVIHGRTGTRSIGLRADFDALPIHEHNQFPHASQHPGKMHACGHDGHTTMLLAAAQYLAAHRNFAGTVYLVFQPAEESHGGAKAMMEDGLFERFPMDAIFGIHNWPGLAAGDVAVRSGPCFASSNEFRITLRGEGCHGAMPHLGVDPIIIASQLVQAFQTIISRNLHPADAGVISVTIIEAGDATNVIPETATLRGTVRAFTTAVLDTIENRMRELTHQISAAFGACAKFEFERRYPPTINHAKEAEFVRHTLSEVLGSEHVHVFEPTMGAEDFSFYLQEKPGAYFVVGNGELVDHAKPNSTSNDTGKSSTDHRPAGHGLGPCALHNPSYDFNDALLPLGGTLWVRLVEAWLEN